MHVLFKRRRPWSIPGMPSSYPTGYFSIALLSLALCTRSGSGDTQTLNIPSRWLCSLQSAFHHAMLDRSARQEKLILPAAEWHCMMKIYAQYRGKLRRDGEFRWYKLNDACKEETVDDGHSYRALPRAK